VSRRPKKNRSNRPGGIPTAADIYRIVQNSIEEYFAKNGNAPTRSRAKNPGRSSLADSMQSIDAFNSAVSGATPAQEPQKKQNAAPGSFFNYEVLSKGAFFRLKAASQQARSVYRQVTRAAVLYDVAGREGFSGGLAEGELVQTGLEVGRNLAKNRDVRRAAKQISEIITGDKKFGASVLKSLGSALGLAGGAAAVALTAVSAASELFAQRRASARAQIDTFNAGTNLEFEASNAKSIRNRIRQSVEGTRGIVGVISDSLGYTEQTEGEVSRRTIEQLNTYNTARDNAQRMGINVDAVLNAAAKKKGVSVNQLTPGEKNEALDPVVQAEVKSRVTDDMVDKEVSSRGLLKDGFQIRDPQFQSLPNVAETMKRADREASNAFLEGQRLKIRQELEERVVNEIAGRNEVERRAAEKSLSQRTPEQRQQIDRDLRNSTFKLAAQRSRRKQKRTD